MKDLSYEEWDKLTDRCCDALALAYNPRLPLIKKGGFYIPSTCGVQEDLGDALREILGEDETKPYHWADSVKWTTILNLNRLGHRILIGLQEVTRGDSDSQDLFEMYMQSNRFQHMWISQRGDFFRFHRGGIRRKALNEFRNYWDENEKERWQEIRRAMREIRARKSRKSRQ